MGKVGRLACIFTPMLLTIASFICLTLIQVAGWHESTLPDLYFFKANLTNLDTNVGSNEALTAAITAARSNISDEYRIYLWNYCQESDSDGEESDDALNRCSGRKSYFVFDPLRIWGLEVSNSTANAISASSDNSLVQSAIDSVRSDLSEYETRLIGSSGRRALSTYRKVARWMFIAYQVAFWTALASIPIALFALFSRWGSFCTWLLAFASSLFTLAAVITSTALFSVLVSALNRALEDYNVHLSVGRPLLQTAWLAVVFSWAASLFWLFSACCCSGRSNPHHRSNKGGLWAAEPKGQGYGSALMGEKTVGRGYQPVSSPRAFTAQEDQVPLHGHAEPTGYSNDHEGTYEPYRHR